MCGIYGMVALGERPLAHPDRLSALGATLRHRGPDSSRVIEGKHVAIGCERLRIVDLLERADQPFHEPTHRHWLASNGEIYNAPSLRSRYAGYPFQSRSDIEPILPLLLDRGTAGVADLDGMFALAFWDDAERRLMLARDRAGEKPLYYLRRGDEVWFASEVQALLVHPQQSRDLDRSAIDQFLRFGYIPAPRTAFRGIRKLPAGTVARFDARDESIERYWQPGGWADGRSATIEDAGELAALLRAAVRKQLTADVPIGIFVSGGVDSALVATLAARASSQRLHTYVARFADTSFDESSWAAACARRAGTRHHEVSIDDQALVDAFEAVTHRLGEPLADPAILPTYLLARRARQDVRVVLGGEGADELFGGYPTYLGHRLARSYRHLPRFARRLVRAGIARLPPSRGRVPIEFLLKRFVSHAEASWFDRHTAWVGVDALSFAVDPNGMSMPDVPVGCTRGELADTERAMLLDYLTYLPDDLLVKTDRATMMCSIEARSPFLDRHLSSFALRLPLDAKVRGATTKLLLKQVAEQWLPKDLVHRRKRGLSVPVARFMDNGLAKRVNHLLEPSRLARQGLLDADAVSAALAAHRSGTANLARPLWTLVCLERWLERWLPDRFEPGRPRPRKARAPA